MLTIHKYRIDNGVDYYLTLRKDAKFVMAGVDGIDAYCLWFLINIENETETRVFRIFLTGAEIPKDYQYLQSFSQYEAQYIWHVFEKIN